MGGGGGGLLNNRLFSLLFSGNVCGGDKALMEGDKDVTGGSPSPPLRKTLAVNDCSCVIHYHISVGHLRHSMYLFE